jgi:hypothetical protein
MISIRPENIIVSKESQASEQNSLEGAVERVMFLGEVCDCRVSVRNTSLRMRTHPFLELAQGERVFLSLPVTACSVMRLKEI